MPGVFGFVGDSDDSAVLESMQELLLHRKEYTCSPFFHDSELHAGQCGAPYENVGANPYRDRDLYCWIDGEVYNSGHLAGEFELLNDITSPGLMLLKAVRNGTLFKLLSAMDGYFAAVVYDSTNRTIRLITDRYGFRHLYWYKKKNLFCWSSEYKAFSAVPGFEAVVDSQSLEEFLLYGCLCENRTWFRDVDLLGPGNVLTLYLESLELHTRTYWSPEKIRTMNNFNLYEYCLEWGDLFRKSVNSRYDETTGITLSGGLDSRAILAAMPEVEGIPAVTLGSRNSDDVRFASRAASLKKSDHHILDLIKMGWLKRALRGVWATDGALCISSQLGIEHLVTIGRLMSASMNGIGGGRMQGGKVISGGRHHEEDCMGPEGPGLQMIRRRMLVQGFRLDESYFRTRMPFFSNELYELVMSVPDQIRQKGTLYRDVLLFNFPCFYRTIPWQQAGVPISLPGYLFDAGSFALRVQKKISSALGRRGFPIKGRKNYFSVEDMLRTEESQDLIVKLLDNDNAVYPNFLSGRRLNRLLKPRRLAYIGTEELCRILTFEIWMRQFFNKEFRPERTD
ncbi:MAG: asparagine synthase-related protein [Chitinispirillaceae bacterium]